MDLAGVRRVDVRRANQAGKPTRRAKHVVCIELVACVLAMFQYRPARKLRPVKSNPDWYTKILRRAIR